MVIVQLTMLVYQRVLCLFFIYWQRNCPGEKNKCHCIAVSDHLSYCWQQERRITQHLSWVKHQEAINKMFHQAEMIPRFMGYGYPNPKHGDVIPRKHLPWRLGKIDWILWHESNQFNGLIINQLTFTHIYIYNDILNICIVTYSYILLTVNYEWHTSHFLWLHPNCSCLNHPFSSPNCGGGSPCAKQHTIAAGRLDGRARRPLPLLEPWLQIAD